MIADSKPRAKIRCKLCDFSCPVWWMNKSGKPKSGWDRLREHFHDDHPVEAEAIEKQVYGDLERDLCKGEF